MLADQIHEDDLLEALKLKGFVEPKEFYLRINRPGSGVTEWPGCNLCIWQPRRALVKPWSVGGCKRPAGSLSCTCAEVEERAVSGRG
jgi:hypothetical protein